MPSGYSLWDLFMVIHKPDDKRPWIEVQDADPPDIHKLLDLANRLSNPPRLSPENVGWLFRGQADRSWTLVPTLWREFKSLDPTSRDHKKSALRIKYDSIAYFRARSRSLIDLRLIPAEDDLGGWLTLMQHYRAPTRMMDWTTSLNVALYFASADYCAEVRAMKDDGSVLRRCENQQGAVWFFDHSALRSWMCENGYAPCARERYAEIFRDAESFVSYGLDHARPNIWPTFPDRPTDRMIAQSSIHLFSEMPLCDYARLIGKALLDYWKGPLEERPNILPLIKLVIPAKAKAALREYLIKIGIHASTLFPGLDGIGNTISEMVELERMTYLPRSP